MTPHASAEHEQRRLAAVRRYEILDTPPDGAFDRITSLAARIFSVPISIISLVDEDRIWFKSGYGVDVPQIGRAPGLCASAILQDEPWVLPDAAKDIRSLTNPLVAGEFGLRFYAGAPLKTSDGYNLGTLCVIDREPRQISEKDIAQLDELAAIVMDEMELRLAARRRFKETEELIRDGRAQTNHLETLNKTGAALAAELELEKIVQIVTEAGVELTGAKFGAFFYNIINEAGESLLLYTLAGAERSAFEKFGHPRATEVFAPTFRGDGVVRSDDITKDSRYGKNEPNHGMPKGHLPVKSYLAVPVSSRSGEPIGGLFFGHPEEGVFDAAAERLMVGLAGQAAIAIDNARLFEAAQRATATLEQRVAERTSELEAAHEALRQSQKMEAVGQLTGGIAHDFNNLLTIITGNVDIARRSLEGGETSRAARAIDNAQKGAGRAAALTQRLLAFSRRQPLAPKPINVDRLVNGMADLLHRALGETVQLETISNPALWLVEADPNQLESAILNLAVNSRDAMRGGGKLTIETANARLDEEYSAAHAEVAPGSYVVIAITDTGEGMSKETVARVFDPFFTTKEVGKGTGLGLSMVYGFVKQSGGHVKIYSEPGVGTTVKVYLPRLMSGEEAQNEPAQHGIDRAVREHTILLVEDDDDVRAYTVEILRELGYRVLEAHDGPSALRLMERQDTVIDLLFTDVVMPGMSGRELAEAAREHRSDLKVLYTSGYTRNAIMHGGRLDSGVEMIAKPFTYQGLAEKIREVLDRGQTGRVLVVEGDATVRAFAVEALELAKYAADEAANASEALNRVRAAQGRYDAVLLDAALPDKSGDALAVELRALYANLPILLISSEDEQELRERFAADRCVNVIGKPFNSARLHRALQELGLECSGHETP
jgi:signal transduction histidine kinase/DNA-binding response OmpR family regulator